MEEKSNNNLHKQREEFKKRWEEIQKRQDEWWARQKSNDSFNSGIFEIKVCSKCKIKKDKLFVNEFEDGKVLCNPCYYNTK